MINIEYLIEGRTKYKFNKSQFARELGITVRHYRNIENGTSTPQAGILRKMCMILDLDANKLIRVIK